MRIAKPLLLVMTPIGIAWGLVEAARFHWWLALLMGALVAVIGLFTWNVVKRIRQERALPFSAPAERNKGPILGVLKTVLPDSGTVLEIASGTGQHVELFAKELANLQWQPTEPDTAKRNAIGVRIREAMLANVAPAVVLDVTADRWSVAERFDAVVCINLTHVSPWSTTEALLRGVARHLPPQGTFVLYGPFLENGTAAPSNLEFDASLKRMNAEWGLRALEEVTRMAAEQGLARQQVVRMPANNLTLVFTRAA